MATSQIQTVNTGADKAKLATASVLVVAALAAFYLLGKQGPLVQWVALIAGLLAAAGVFFSSEAGKQLVGFGRDAWREVKKSGLAFTQGSNPDYGLCVWIRADHGLVPLVDGQDA